MTDEHSIPVATHGLFNRVSKTLLLILCLSALSGCARWQSKDDSFQQHLWSLDAKIGVKLDDKSHKANLSWTYYNNGYRILLFGPFGQGKVEILKKDKRFTLIDNNDIQHADTAELLLLKATGWDLPISALENWIVGRADNKFEIENRKDEQGLLKSFEQSGWAVTYKSRFENDAGSLPKKILIERRGMRLLIVAKKWMIDA